MIGEVFLAPNISRMALFWIVSSFPSLVSHADDSAVAPYSSFGLMYAVYILSRSSLSAPQFVPAMARMMFSLWLVWIRMSLMCSFHVKVGASSVIPRYLKVFTY